MAKLQRRQNFKLIGPLVPKSVPWYRRSEALKLRIRLSRYLYMRTLNFRCLWTHSHARVSYPLLEDRPLPSLPSCLNKEYAESSQHDPTSKSWVGQGRWGDGFQADQHVPAGSRILSLGVDSGWRKGNMKLKRKNCWYRCTLLLHWV